MGNLFKTKQRATACAMSAAMLLSMVGVLPQSTVSADPSADAISNSSLSAKIGDLGQISSLTINNNPKNSNGNDVNFVLPNDTATQNNANHQWMGEMIFSYRTSSDGKFSDDEDFVEVDTNRTLAAGGSTTYSNASENLKSNPYIEKTVDDDSVTVKFKGQDTSSTTARTMKGFDVTSEYDMATDDGSLQWNITLENTSSDYIEFGDVGLPMPWNNAYTSIDDTYNNRVTVHTFAGADSGYAYAIRTSGEDNYVLFTPVTDTGAKIEYIDTWQSNKNGVVGTRSDSIYSGWTTDDGNWYPGLSVYYIHSKDIQKTGSGYFTDASSLVLKPGEKKTYSFKFSAVRAGDNSPQTSASDSNNSSTSVEERENNMRSILYKEGLIDAIAVPGFQTAINMSTQLDLHYDESQVSDVSVDVQCIHENNPWDESHIPQQTKGLVNSSNSVTHGGDATATLKETKTVNGETHHIYNIDFKCIGNNSVRVTYKSNGEEKFTEYEFNVLDEISDIINTHSDFAVNSTQDNDENSATYGIYSDWYFASGRDTTQQTHWGDDWSHDNINFMAMKNYLDPEADEVASIEKYLIDFMWENYMKNTQDTYTIANYLSSSGIYSDTETPYTRTYSEVMEVTGFFNMYRIEKAYPDLMEYRQPAEWYLDKAYNIYINRVDAYVIGYYGEQQIPQMIEALYDEGMTEQAKALQERFANEKGTNMAEAAYPYGSEFEYDNTGEEGAYSAAKALREYYLDSESATKALSQMEKAEWKTRAMRGIQPTWYQYADPVFRGGESWWNFQYTASLAGYIMDDWLRYEDTDASTSSSAWAERVNYAAKLSNFNAVNMGQISSDYIGNVSWRYTMSKGGVGAQNVNDGGTRVMNNGWNDFSGESDEGLYGSLLSISSDVATDDIFGLVGYGCMVSKAGGVYTVTPQDGVGKRINIIDDKIYVELEQDACTKAVINENGQAISLSVNNTSGKEHLLKINLSGAGIKDGYYTVKANGTNEEQCYVTGNESTAYVVVPEGESATITIAKKDSGENEAPKIFSVSKQGDAKALSQFHVLASAYDDGATGDRLTYKWETVSKPEGAEVSFTTPTQVSADVTTSLAGDYTFKFSVSDGKLTTEKELKVTVANPDPKTVPVIDSATATQDAINTTTANLKAEATADAIYDNDLSYKWEVTSQPEGTAAVVGNATKAEATLKAYTPGEYKLKLTVTDKSSTVYDADLSTVKEITVNMTGDVDGIDRTDTVVTGVGEKPTLARKMKVVHTDGTITTERIKWASILKSTYSTVGEFEVEGTTSYDGEKILSKVAVVNGSKANLATSAKATAIIDTPSDLGGVAGLNDGYEPASSYDKTHGVWHNWHGNQSGEAWVQYEWDEDQIIFQSDAYYFTDGNFIPATVKYQYRDANGNWVDVNNAVGLGNDLNQYNTTTFSPVKTKAIRMIMTPKTAGVGVIEWKVWGYGEGDEEVIDKTDLSDIIEKANSLDLAKFTLTEGEKTAFNDTVKAAQTVYDDKKATQEQVDVQVVAVTKAIGKLKSSDGNLAYTATVTTSFVSSWEKLAGVNDGQLPESSYNPDNKVYARYGTWGNTSEYETITYTWDNAVKVAKSDIYFWYDGDEGDYTSGGILVPKNYKYEYLAADGSWKEVVNPSAYATEMDKFNETSFDTVTTTAVRVTMTKQSNDGSGVGVMEWQVFGETSTADKTALKAAMDTASNCKESRFTTDSWKAMQSVLETANSVYSNEEATQYEVAKVADSLNKAIDALVAYNNVALEAKSSGICDYKEDLGGVAGLNDDKQPTSSTDKTNGAWHNWHDRYKTGTQVQNAWVTYTWDETVEIDTTDVYYFTDNSGILMPKSVTFEYKDENGDWKEITNAKGLGCEADAYNTTDLGGVITTALRMTMVPQTTDVEVDPAKGVGVVEWRVNGKYVDSIDPSITGAESGKTYCAPVTVKVADANLSEVILDVNDVETQVTLSDDGTYTIQPNKNIQTLVAYDKSGNFKTLTVTVNDGHTGGIADCHSKAECEVCGVEYGEINPDVHTGGTVVKNAKAATSKAEGYTGDTYCKSCDVCIEKGTTIAKLDEVTVKPSVDENAPKTEISVDKEALIKEKLSDVQKEVIAEGGRAIVNVQISDISESVSKKEKNLAEKKLSEGSKVGCYFDISMFITVLNADGSVHSEDAISESSALVNVEVSVPTDMLTAPAGMNRTFAILRIHDGVAQILESTFKDGKLSFATDKFSTYAIVYTDTDAVVDDGQTPINNKTVTPDTDNANKTDVSGTSSGAKTVNKPQTKAVSAKTSDDNSMNAWIIFMLFGCLVIAECVRKDRKTL